MYVCLGETKLSEKGEINVVRGGLEELNLSRNEEEMREEGVAVKMSDHRLTKDS